MTNFETRNAHDFTRGALQNRATKVLTRDDLRALTPSVFATAPAEHVSGRYKFVPTTEVVDILESKGYVPVKASQSTCRESGMAEFVKHVLRFRHTDHLRPSVGQEFPELVLSNAHNGLGAYNFMSGLHVLKCSNTLTVPTSDLGSFSVRHMGGADFDQKIIDTTCQIMDMVPLVQKAVEEWKEIQLPAPMQVAFAKAANKIVEVPNGVKPEQLLNARRGEERPDANGNRSLWTTFNVIQENAVKGGIRGRNQETYRRVTTRAIKSVDRDLKVNKALWTLTEELAKLAK